MQVHAGTYRLDGCIQILRLEGGVALILQGLGLGGGFGRLGRAGVLYAPCRSWGRSGGRHISGRPWSDFHHVGSRRGTRGHERRHVRQRATHGLHGRMQQTNHRLWDPRTRQEV